MATIKETTSELDNMIKSINGSLQTNDIANFPVGFGGGMSNEIRIDDDSIPMPMLETEPAFEINYKSTKKQCIKKAFEQMTILVKGVVPIALQDSKIIMEKIKQDADQLGALYYEYEKADKMQQVLMDSVRRGDLSPKSFEQFTKLGLRTDKLIDQITTTQNQMRKYYIDTYMDLQQKDEVDEKYALPKHEDDDKALPAPEEKEEEVTNVIVGTDNLIKMMADRKKKAIMAKYAEVKENEDKKEND